ncbi:ribosomal protein L7/L12 [Nannocystis bainbridge]|uniref:Ribosomal protein L7/L12 n=1 Tax=Nannocystis bainbridge TaxID=2995303 RepID=A0ABT5E9X3_9BACT|nr:ribosomal protein L7/L12 [Nannocystis bainbridge]MDC0722415.1 ribosomal protein L7/L12 [Nannocystis bainbridge]
MTVGDQSGEGVLQDVILQAVGSNPAAVIETLRARMALEAAAAAELVARTPSAMGTRLAPALAEALRVALVAAGATVELRAHGPAFFDVYLQAQGASKIHVVRALKRMMGFGLREAVELVDDAPCLVRRQIVQEEAEALRDELLEAGATVEVRAHESSAPPERAVSGESAAVTWGAGGNPPTPVPPSAASSSPKPVPPGAASSSSKPVPPGEVSSEPGLPEPKRGYGVVLRSNGGFRIPVIRIIRQATTLGLQEAKELAESTDVMLKDGLSWTEVWVLARALTAVGASVDVRGPARR